MKGLSTRYFYGVLLAAAFSCFAMSELYFVFKFNWSAPIDQLWRVAAASALAFALVGVFIGFVPAVILLAIPLAIFEEKGKPACVAAGALSGAAFVASGFLGVWPANSVRSLLNGLSIEGLVGLVAPLLVGALAGLVFYLVTHRTGTAGRA